MKNIAIFRRASQLCGSANQLTDDLGGVEGKGQRCPSANISGEAGMVKRVELSDECEGMNFHSLVL